MMTWLAVLGGAVIGVTLGLIGGGGSILAMPMMNALLGPGSTHVAIGTAAVAVTTSALANLGMNARHGLIKWRCAIVFALSGVAGAAAGAALGQRTDATHLLFLFGLLMIGVGGLMFRPRRTPEAHTVRLDRQSAPYLAPRLLALGLGTGFVSGYFGIGGGFLIVPALVLATSMPMIMAVASSLVAVSAFGLTTAVSYANAGLVDWPLAGLFVLGGTLGGLAGSRLARRLSTHEDALTRVFAVIVIVVGAWISVTASIQTATAERLRGQLTEGFTIPAGKPAEFPDVELDQNLADQDASRLRGTQGTVDLLELPQLQISPRADPEVLLKNGAKRSFRHVGRLCELVG